MSTIQQKIYDYFDRDPELRVLFIFNQEFLAMELEGLEWRTGYRYVDFKGTGSRPSTILIMIGSMKK